MTSQNTLLTFLHTQSKICMLSTISFSLSLHRKNARVSILPILVTGVFFFFFGKEYCTSVNLNLLSRFCHDCTECITNFLAHSIQDLSAVNNFFFDKSAQEKCAGEYFVHLVDSFFLAKSIALVSISMC